MGNSDEHSTALRRNNQQFIHGITRKRNQKEWESKDFYRSCGLQEILDIWFVQFLKTLDRSLSLYIVLLL